MVRWARGMVIFFDRDSLDRQCCVRCRGSIVIYCICAVLPPFICIELPFYVR